MIQTVGALLRMHLKSLECMCETRVYKKYVGLYVANNVELPLDILKFLTFNFLPLLLHIKRIDTFKSIELQKKITKIFLVSNEGLGVM